MGEKVRIDKKIVAWLEEDLGYHESQEDYHQHEAKLARNMLKRYRRTGTLSRGYRQAYNAQRRSAPDRRPT